MEDILLFDSKTTNPYENLAFEAYLLNKMAGGQLYFFLWQNEKAVVIGKNQSPYINCDMEFARRNGIKIARRITGGGAVYHDMGNLNFSFVYDKQKYSADIMDHILHRAYSALGISEVRTERNDYVTENGNKFSGTAKYDNGVSVLYHGCIMVECDVSIMEQVLRVDKEKYFAKNIDSIRSRVVNLKELYPDISVDLLKAAIIDSVREIFGDVQIQPFTASVSKDYESLLRKFQSRKWNEGDIPAGRKLHGRFPWGVCDIYVEIENGYVNNIRIFSDSLNPGMFEKIAAQVSGRRYDVNILDVFPKEYADAGDILGLLLDDIKDFLEDEKCLTQL